MPFKSKAQQRFFFAAEADGELPEGTAHRWAQETPNMKTLPEKVKEAKYVPFSKQAFLGNIGENLKGWFSNNVSFPMQRKLLSVGTGLGSTLGTSGLGLANLYTQWHSAPPFSPQNPGGLQPSFTPMTRSVNQNIGANPDGSFRR